MNIKLTSGASIKPLLCSNLAAYITREAFGTSIRIFEGEFQQALVQLVCDFEWSSCTDHMKIKLTVTTVVAEAVSTVVAGITVESAARVLGCGEEVERVVGVGGVSNQLWEFGTAQMKSEVARLTYVHLA